MTHALRTQTSSNIYGDGGETRTQTETGTPGETSRQLEVLTVQTGMVNLMITQMRTQGTNRLQGIIHSDSSEIVFGTDTVESVFGKDTVESENWKDTVEGEVLFAGVTQATEALVGTGPPLDTMKHNHAGPPLTFGGRGGIRHHGAAAR